MENFSNTFGNSAAAALPEQRASFIRKTYMILAAAILAFIVVEGFLFASGAANLIANVVFSGGAMGWLLVLGLFMGVSYLSQRWATSDTSTVTQYLGLGLFIVAEAVVFVPMIMISTYYAGDASVLMKAGIVTLGLFLGITATVFITRTDFSFLGPIIAIGGFARKCVRVCNGGFCGNGDPLRDVERPASLQYEPACGGGSYAIRERGPSLLVHSENLQFT
jgi:FtsH-binding integral membrane protein